MSFTLLNDAVGVVVRSLISLAPNNPNDAPRAGVSASVASSTGRMLNVSVESNSNAGPNNTGGEIAIGNATPNISPNTRNLNSIDQFNQGPVLHDVLYFPTELLSGNGQIGVRYPHAMAFFINVNSKSRLGKFMTTDIGKHYVAAKSLDTTRDFTDGLDSGVGERITTIASTGGVGAANQQIGKWLSDSGPLATYKRFTGCIMLPIPLQVIATYGAQYNDAALGGVLGALAKNANAGNISDLLINGGADVLRSEASKIAKNAAGMLQNAGAIDSTNVGGIFDKAAGTVSNPRTEQVFSKMNTRTFFYSWHIPISSEKEWNTIRRIISMFKENMYPEIIKGGDSAYMTMPNEFDIEFHENVGGKFSESTTIPKVSTCVLADLEVDYTPLGHWVAFEGTMIPPFVMIRMSFKELEPLHRRMVRDVGDNNGSRFTADDTDFTEGGGASASSKYRRGF